VDTGPSLTPEELPLRGETMLPDIGRPLPDIRIIPQGDHRGKSGMGQASDNQPGLHIDEVALRAYIEAMADIFQEPHLSLFIVADSTGEFYSYGYRIIDFHPVEQELSGGQRELYIYVHPNEAGDGLYRMNVGLIPRTQSAFEDYQRWLLPEYHENGKPVFSPANARAKQEASQIQGTVRICIWVPHVIVGPQSGSPEGWAITYYPACWSVWVPLGGSPQDTGPGGGNGCWETDSCRPNTGGDGRDGLDRTGCDGDPKAFRDHCGRCVGGDTRRFAAPAGADCNNLNIPCAGDVVKNPEITSPGASGKTGGRFRPCVGTPCLEELRAVRNDGVDPHHGTDITCTVGDPIYAPFDMSGLERGYQVNSRGRGYGYFVRGWTTVNGERRNFGVSHLQAAGRASGSIKRGDIIGYCGRSGIPNTRLGNSTTTHAHLEFGTQVVFFSGTRSSRLNPELVLSTKFANTSEATPLNPNPCGQ